MLQHYHFMRNLISEQFRKMMIAELNNRHRTYKTTHPAPYGYSFFINETHFYEFSKAKNKFLEF